MCYFPSCLYMLLISRFFLWTINENLVTWIHAIGTLKLDYCNAFYGLKKVLLEGASTHFTSACSQPWSGCPNNGWLLPWVGALKDNSSGYPNGQKSSPRWLCRGKTILEWFFPTPFTRCAHQIGPLVSNLAPLLNQSIQAVWWCPMCACS